MSDCIFCQIVAGKHPIAKVYEDDLTLAFMDHLPVSPGHTLVIPKCHAAEIYELDEETAARLFQTVVIVAKGIRDSLHPDGLNVFQSNGRAAGQVIFHVHVHLVPRRSGDGLIRLMRTAQDIHSPEILDTVAGRIRRAIQGIG